MLVIRGLGYVRELAIRLRTVVVTSVEFAGKGSALSCMPYKRIKFRGRMRLRHLIRGLVVAIAFTVVNTDVELQSEALSGIVHPHSQARDLEVAQVIAGCAQVANPCRCCHSIPS